MLSQEPLLCYFDTNDHRPVLVFATPDRATAFLQTFENNGGQADRYYDPLTVFLRKPYGLELVHAGPQGELAFDLKSEAQAQHWFKQLGEYATLLQTSDEAEGMKRTVLLGRKRSV